MSPLLPLPQYIPLLGPFGVSGFLLAALAGGVAGRALTGRLLRDRPALRAPTLESLVPLLLGALVGGRLGNQLAIPDLRWAQPLTWLSATGTSLSYAGAVVGALLAVWWSLRPRPAGERLAVLDALAPGVALALGIGWLGMPALGRPEAAFRAPLYGGVGVQPVQLYGLLGFAGLAALLWWQRDRLDYAGQGLVTLVALGSAFRFVLGFAVPAPLALPPWSATQLADAALALLALGAALRWGHRPGAFPAGPRPAVQPAPPEGEAS